MRLALIAAAIVALAAEVLWIGIPIPVGDAALLTPPPRAPLAAWGRPGVERFDVTAGDGTPLRGWILRGRPGAPWLLVCYGNAGSMSSTLGLASWFRSRLGLTTVLWDYRGFGFSGGTPGALATRDDALRVYDAVRTRAGGAPFVYGLSFGTTIAVHLAARRPVRALVLQAPPASARDEVRWLRDHLPWPLRHLRPMPSRSVQIALDEAREIAAVRAPLLVLHGDADTLIPIVQGRAVERAAGSRDKRFVTIPGAEHTTVAYEGTPAGDAIAAFLRGH
jgi:hypothetical protein